MDEKYKKIIDETEKKLLKKLMQDPRYAEFKPLVVLLLEKTQNKPHYLSKSI